VSDRFAVLTTPINGLVVLQRKPIGDDRGYLERLYCFDDLGMLASGKRIEQVNHTFTASSGTVRGLHFQYPPHEETKFVHCLRGQVFDVAVDLRQSSPTFLHWHAEILDERNFRTLVIPAGFAHGFQTLSDNCEMLYFHTAAYVREAEGGLNSRDSRLAISWPLPVSGLSPRDAGHPMLSDDFKGLTV
jgi:dTDP-4-dehydrorhamnose 3,5-epimerase